MLDENLQINDKNKVILNDKIPTANYKRYEKRRSTFKKYFNFYLL